MVSDSSRKIFCIVSFVVYIVALLFFLFGFSSPYWYYEEGSPDYRGGLWKYCYRYGSSWSCSYYRYEYQDAWFKTTMGFMVMGMMVAVPAGATRMYMPLSATLEIMAGVFGIIAVSIYGAEIDEVEILGWAYWFTVTGSAIFLINGIALAVLTGVTKSCNMKAHMPCAKLEVEPI